MKNMQKRVAALEQAVPVESEAGRIDLSSLTDSELDRLEGIATAVEAGTPLEAMSDDNLRFIAGLPAVGEA